MKSYDDAAEFHRFFEEHHRVLARLAYLLVGDTEAADDLTADAFIATWRRWDRATADDRPIATVRRNVIELAARKARSITRERGPNGLIRAEVRYDHGEPSVPSGLRPVAFSAPGARSAVPSAPGRHPDVSSAPGSRPGPMAVPIVPADIASVPTVPTPPPDAPSVPGLRVTLRRLSPRRRACVALRCAFDLPEAEVAAALDISARVVAKETARAVTAFERALDARRSPRARTGGRSGGGARANQPPDWLRFALYREAYAHEPDRARMRSRVAAALRARVTRRARVRMAAAGAAAVAVATAAVVTLPRITGSSAPAAPDTGALSPANAPVLAQPNDSAMVVRPGRPVMSFAARVDGRDSDYWSQDILDVTSDRPLTALRVTLRVARTRGARLTGSWLSLSPEDFDVATDTNAHTLVYRWTLKPGHKVPTGTVSFAGQYQHGNDRRDFREDGYTVTASGGSGRPADSAGHF